MSSVSASMNDLPMHIMADILSRIPVKTIIHCKCVCKKWQNLLSNSDFANFHLSRSRKGLMIHHRPEEPIFTVHKGTGFLKLVEMEDESDHHQFHHDPVMSLDLDLGVAFQSSRVLLVGSVNGLVCLWQYSGTDNTYICNPITREYMILPRQRYYRESTATIVYGFGFSSTGQYKVVRIFEGDIPPKKGSASRPSLLEGEVYPLGSVQWRDLGHIPYWLSGYHGPFMNGSAHWSVIDKDSPEEICTFDFEKETFQLFPSPPEGRREAKVHFGSLGVLRGCLSQSDTFDFSEFTIWVMKEYGIKESWNKEVVIRSTMNPDLDWVLWEPVYLIDGLKDGTILMVYYEDELLAYSPATNTVEDTKIFIRYLWAMTYVPSFIRLGNFEAENVLVF